MPIIGRSAGLSDFNFGEIKMSTMRTGPGLIKLQLPQSLTIRTLYGFHYAQNSTSDWYFIARITMSLGGGQVAQFPFEGGTSTTTPPSVLPRSLPSVLATSSSALPVGHSLQVVVKEPLSGTPAESGLYYCQPFQIDIESDLLSVDLVDFQNITGMHMFVACQSDSQ